MGETIYLSGPISGAGSEWALPFMDAERYFADLGWEVVNPATLDPLDNVPEHGLSIPPIDTLRAYLQRDFGYLAVCDAMALFHGWRLSRGANAELAAARMMGMPVYFYTGEPLAEHFITEALPHQDLVTIVIGGWAREQVRSEGFG